MLIEIEDMIINLEEVTHIEFRMLTNSIVLNFKDGHSATVNFSSYELSKEVYDKIRDFLNRRVGIYKVW